MSKKDSSPVDPKVAAGRAKRLRWYYKNRERANAKNREWCQKNRERKNAWHRQWAAKNREKVKAWLVRWKARNPEKVRAKQKAYRERRREHLKQVSRRNHLRRKYGITAAEFQALWDRQAGRCAICGTTDPGPLNQLCVDHCHTTNEIRGLLCFHCNSGIGHLRHDPDLFKKASAYLRKKNPKARRTGHPAISEAG